MKRRTFVLGASAAVATLPGAGFALDTASAKRLVDALVGDINRVIASGKSESAMIKDFARIFGKYSDTSYISAYAMGNDGRRASNAQKRAFSTNFQSYIARKYGKRFREFIGGQIVVNSAKPVKSYFEVKTTANLRGQSPFDVTFLVSNRTGKDLFFNMYIEGINLLLTERTEIGAMIDKRGGNLDAMIADLKTAG